MEIPTTARGLIALFKRLHIRADKRRGQNFLVDANLLRFIAEAADLAKDDVALEVGTGTGLLARELAARCARLVTVEIDEAVAGLAEKFLEEFDNVALVRADVLKRGALNPAVLAEIGRALAASAKKAGDLKIVSNLPYGISTPFITAVVEGALPFAAMVITVQKEVAERLTAAAGTKEYGYLTVVVNYGCEVAILKTLPPQAFWPEPEVSSAVVRIVPRAQAGEARDYETLRALCRAIFTHRRKNLLNSLAYGFGGMEKAALEGAIRAAGIEPGVRGEKLSVEHLAALSNELFAAGKKKGV